MGDGGHLTHTFSFTYESMTGSGQLITLSTRHLYKYRIKVRVGVNDNFSVNSYECPIYFICCHCHSLEICQ